MGSKARQRESLASAASATAQWTVTNADRAKNFEFSVTTTGSWAVLVEGRDHDDDSWAPLTTTATVDTTTEYFSVVTAYSQVRLNGTRTGGNLTAVVTSSDFHPTRW